MLETYKSCIQIAAVNFIAIFLLFFRLQIKGKRENE